MRRRVRKQTKTSVGEVWSDLDHNFLQDGVGGLKRVVNVEAVYTSIDNILRTYKGERVMLPEFASDMHGLLFRRMNSTLVSFTTRILKDTIEAWDDRVRIEEISLTQSPDHNEVGIGMVFLIRGYNDTFKYEARIKGTYS